jgi:hypothetical protein
MKMMMKLQRRRNTANVIASEMNFEAISQLITHVIKELQIRLLDLLLDSKSTKQEDQHQQKRMLLLQVKVVTPMILLHPEEICTVFLWK